MLSIFMGCGQFVVNFALLNQDNNTDEILLNIHLLHLKHSEPKPHNKNMTFFKFNNVVIFIFMNIMKT